MAEVIGVASGVAGLLSLTIEVIGITYKYVIGVRNAPDAVRGLMKELAELKVVLLKLDELSKTESDREVFGENGSCLLSIKDSSDYVDLLQQIHRKLEERHGHDGFRKRIKALAWPFSQEKTLSLIEMLHRHLERYKTALAIDTLTLGKLTLSTVRQSTEDSEFVAILDWLSPLNMYQRQQDTLSRRHGSTGSWLLSTEAFQNWVHSEGSNRTLWCPGDRLYSMFSNSILLNIVPAGTGKTIMTSIVVDHLNTRCRSEDVRIAYVYCDYKDQVIQSAPNLIACLARQLIEGSRKIPQRLQQLYKKLELQRRKPGLEELKNLLVDLCNERERTYVLLDALDECEAIHERRRLLPLLHALPHGSTRLFVTSRPNNEDIRQVFKKAAQIVIAAPSSDIQCFVLETMEERKDFVERLTPQLKDQIITTISARASGMFLLAVLQIDRICIARTIKQIKCALESMPRELDGLYHETLKRIRSQPGDDGDLGMRVLSWVSCARRPLSVDELRYGLAVEYDLDNEQPTELDKDNILLPKSLADVCAGLVVIDPASQTVRLVHYTTQEFFDKERLNLFDKVDEDIARACLTHLSYDICTVIDWDESQAWNILLSYPFLKYATIHWLSHVQGSYEQIEQSPVFLAALKYVNDTTKLRFAALIWRIILLQPQLYSPSDARKREGMLPVTPLEAASECGLRDFVKFLLDQTTWSKDLDISLHCAASKGHADVVRLLIRYGAKASFIAQDGSTALHRASKGGHLEVAISLVNSDPGIINTPDRWLWASLHHAAHQGHFTFVRFLVRKCADQDAQTPFGLTACHLAASRGDLESTQLLSVKYIEGNEKLRTRKGRTPLHSAAQGGHLGPVRILLRNGADVFAVDENGLTAKELISKQNLIPNQYSELNLDSNAIDSVFAVYLEASLKQQPRETLSDDDREPPSQGVPEQKSEEITPARDETFAPVHTLTPDHHPASLALEDDAVSEGASLSEEDQETVGSARDSEEGGSGPLIKMFKSILPGSMGRKQMPKITITNA